MFSSCNPKFFAVRHIHYPMNPSSDHFHTDAVVPSSDHDRTETVPPSRDHYGTTKVAPPCDHFFKSLGSARLLLDATPQERICAWAWPVQIPDDIICLILFLYICVSRVPANDIL